LDGSNPTAIVGGLNAAWPVVADVSAHKVYWGDVNTNRIQRANLDGTSVETVVSGPFSFIDDPAGVAVDSDNQQLYWTDFVIDKIARTDLVTHTTVTLVTGEKRIPLGIDLDLDAGRLEAKGVRISRDVYSPICTLRAQSYIKSHGL
jgi:DNA-binding beta-propeller fold protein YncE